MAEGTLRVGGASPTPRWRQGPLAGQTLHGPQGRIGLERRTAGLLAYLALEGPTSKFRLAELLWPDSGEERARNTMRQLLRRLRQAAGAELVVGLEAIQLAEGVMADAAWLETHVFAGRHAQALALEGELLAGHEFDDCPDFASSKGRYHLMEGRPGDREVPSSSHLRFMRANLEKARPDVLEPLPAQAVRQLLEGMDLPGAAPLAPQMARYTGGNPLFVVETVKHLVETGGLTRGWPERLPPPGRVAPLIQQRLERLSPGALQLAQVAALALTRFSLELAAEVLEVGVVSLGPAVAELERAQVLARERFTHDLVFEAVRAAIPDSLAALLHRRLARVLTSRGAPLPVVSWHMQEAGAA